MKIITAAQSCIGYEGKVSLLSDVEGKTRYSAHKKIDRNSGRDIEAGSGTIILQPLDVNAANIPILSVPSSQEVVLHLDVTEAKTFGGVR